MTKNNPYIYIAIEHNLNMDYYCVIKFEHVECYIDLFCYKNKIYIVYFMLQTSAKWLFLEYTLILSVCF